jgi:peptide deformylase
VAVREVLVYPHPALKATAKPVDGPEAERVAADLVDTMQAHSHCSGLAATQLGELVRLVAVDVTGHPKASAAHGLLLLVNPRVVDERGAEVAREGCLSIPHLTANVRRATHIVVEAVTPAPRDRPSRRAALPRPGGLARHGRVPAQALRRLGEAP